AGALARARSEGIAIEEITTDARWSALRASLPEHDRILDALLGTGTTGAARGRILEAILAVNASGCPVTSVDIPSGLSGSSAEVPGPCVEADVTLALAALKIPHAFAPACRFAGRIEVLDIGIPAAALEAEKVDLLWVDAQHAASLLPRREPESHKGSFGHVLILAGSRGRGGAAALMARACLRSGAGLVTVATPGSAQAIVASCVPEAMTEPLPETQEGSLAPAALPILRKLIEERDVLAAGPGLGTGPGAAAVVSALAAEGLRPMVLDADALNVLPSGGGAIAGGERRVILTPHPGEAGRLLGRAAPEVQRDCLGSVRLLASRCGATILLKGFRSLTGTPDGSIRVNSTGNPGMATGGSGDVLAGIAAAWLAQGLDAVDASALSAFVHGLAGDLAADDKGTISLVAGDIVEALPRAYLALDPDVRPAGTR
ncbi:MAG: NAD(P)H-hydrate dehydratase, partial [Planctomycetes bacterium]|nr:NAD(P)H-hydrate dehydratase [Planctomycetota bacterium]